MPIFPSANTWITARSDEAHLTDQNCKIILPQKIDKIDKVVLYLPYVEVSFYSPALPKASLSQLYYDEAHTKSLVELDITSYVVEKAKYATLDKKNPNGEVSLGPQYLENTWYYEHGGNEIILPNEIVKGNLTLIGNPVIDYIILSAIYNVVYNDGKKDGKLYVYYGPNNSNNRTITSDANFYVLMESRVSVIDAQFRVYYTPLGESVNLTTPKTEPQEHQFTIPFSQQQPIVTASALGKNMQAMANRTGVPIRVVKRRVDTLDKIRKDGTIWREKDANGNRTGNIYRLTSQSISVAGGYAFITERWSKNWMSQSEYVGINREFRSWKIPADIVQRNLHYQDYCYITSNSAVSLPDDCELSDIAKQYVLRSLTKDGLGANTECANMFFYNRDKSGDSGVVLNCSAFGFGNSLVFSGKTKDNLSAGTQRVKSDDNDKYYQYCKDVYYCNEDGTLNNMFVQLASGIQVTANESDDDAKAKAINSYPQVSSSMNTPKGIKLFAESTNPFLVRKDPAEQLNFTYQLHLVTHDSDLVIGAAWANNCPLVANRPNAVNLLYWKLSQPLPKGMQTMSTSWGKRQTESPVAVSYGNNFFTIDPMTCITDEHYNVIVAYNGTSTGSFYMKYTHSYDKIQQEYNKARSGKYRDATFGI